ncbi:MAG: hypothetical protein AAFR77_07035 [Cyanobacteria bacterium J06631_2]
MSNIVRIEYPDLSTEIRKNELTVTGDSLEVVSRDDQRGIVQVLASDSDISIVSGSLDDTIVGGANGDDIDAGAGNDTINAGAGNDTIVGGLGNDTIVGGLGNDTIDAGDGDDVIDIRFGDTITTGKGADTVRFYASQDFDNQELPTITDFESGEDKITVLPSASSSTSQDLVFDRTTGTLLVEGKSTVKVDGDFSLTANDINFEAEELSFSVLNSSETTVYQFVNADSDTNFYTVDVNEKEFIEANLDNYSLLEGSFSSADPTTGAEVEEVHRFFNTSTGSHLFTTSEVERDSVLENLDNYVYEDAKFYGYTDSTIEGATPVYRFYDSIDDIHVFTSSESEKNEMMTDGSGFISEGIAFYGMSTVNASTSTGAGNIAISTDLF